MDFKLSEEEVAHLERLAEEKDAERRRWRPLAVVFVTMMVALTIFGILHSGHTTDDDDGWLSGATLIQSLLILLIMGIAGLASWIAMRFRKMYRKKSMLRGSGGPAGKRTSGGGQGD